MSSGPQHYEQAELLLQGAGTCEYDCPHTGCPHAMARLQEAQAQAMLALAAATAASVLARHGHKISEADVRAWTEVTEPTGSTP